LFTACRVADPAGEVEACVTETLDLAFEARDLRPGRLQSAAKLGDGRAELRADLVPSALGGVRLVIGDARLPGGLSPTA